MTLKSTFKGWLGEKLSGFALWATLDSEIYVKLSDIIIEDDRGSTQVDHLLVSKFGIFVIEIKDYKGWIYGSEHQKQWTQAFKTQKFKFQNPLHQNYRHIKALASFLSFPESVFHNVVIFGPDSTIKTELPPNVHNEGTRKYIHSKIDEFFTDDEVTEIVQVLKDAKKNQIKKKVHLANLEMQHAPKPKPKVVVDQTDLVEGEIMCPKCSSELIMRDGKRGKFYGCSKFPKCRYTGSVQS